MKFCTMIKLVSLKIYFLAFENDVKILSEVSSEKSGKKNANDEHKTHNSSLFLFQLHILTFLLFYKIMILNS